MKTYDETFERVMAERDSYMRRRKEKIKNTAVGGFALACVAFSVFAIVKAKGNSIPAYEKAEDQIVAETASATDENGDVFYYTIEDDSAYAVTLSRPETLESREEKAEKTTFSEETAGKTVKSGETGKSSDEDSVRTETTVKTDDATVKPATTTAVAEMAVTERNWNDRTLPGRFRSVTVDGREYIYPFNTNETRTAKRNGTKTVSAMKIKGYEPSGKEHTTTADIYTLSGFDKKFAIGVKLNGDSNIYPYINMYYQPATLGEFISGVDYDNTVSYGSITLYKGTSFPVNSQNKSDIKKYLLSDKSARIDVNSDWAKGSYVTLSINLEELGIYNKSFRVYESGYVQTNLVGYAYLFYVGKDNVANFLKNSYNITFDQIREINNNAKTTTAVVSDPTYPEITNKPYYVTETTKGYTTKN
ncbi:MAG: hypothetical protein IK085_02695 [Clostridia bacterium]|nr:hypothetical protein [Clostridia bacterium]